MAVNLDINRRAEMDVITIKAPMALNGGGVVALLAFVPAIMDNSMYQELHNSAFFGITTFVFGLALAVTHIICTRKCSLHYEQHDMNPPKGRLLGITLWEPGICAFSTVCK